MKTKFIYTFALFLMLTFAGCSSSANTANAGAADGSSMEKAIKVKSVPEEYQIVRKLCPDCKMKSQGLISGSNGKKHYDVLTVVNANGEELKYYFDITSFFGKW